MIRRLWIIMLVTATAVYVLSSLAGWTIPAVITKPLIMISLILAYLRQAVQTSMVFCMALVFCCLGDTFLLFQETDELFFMLGLGAFLLGHLLYIVSYRLHRTEHRLAENRVAKLRMAFPVLLAGTGWIVILLPRAGPLQIPVIAYAVVITTMVISSIYRSGRTGAASFWCTVAGSVLFMLSDSLIAIDKFLSAIPLAVVWILFTYALAQFLIVQGILLHQQKKKGLSS